MLGRKNYTQAELDQGKAAVDQQLAAYKTLVTAIASATTDKRLPRPLQPSNRSSSTT